MCGHLGAWRARWATPGAPGSRCSLCVHKCIQVPAGVFLRVRDMCTHVHVDVCLCVLESAHVRVRMSVYVVCMCTRACVRAPPVPLAGCLEPELSSWERLREAGARPRWAALQGGASQAGGRSGVPPTPQG